MKLNPIDSPGNNETPSRGKHDCYLIIVAADRDKEIKCFDGQNEGNLAKEPERETGDDNISMTTPISH